jgi:uncharacterized repeat protein (TIGR03803 family)
MTRFEAAACKSRKKTLVVVAALIAICGVVARAVHASSDSLRRGVSTALTVVFVLAVIAQAQTFTVFYNFTIPGGVRPYAGVVQDPSGNLYGTTELGGDGRGVVYELNTAGSETVLYNFRRAPADGTKPQTPLARDKTGNLYGTTSSGGYHHWGTVFKIDTAGNETVLHHFLGHADGCSPSQGLVIDSSGTLFGTTSYCGSSEKGTIFKIDAAGTFTLLHSFTGTSSDGAQPQWGHLALGKSGELYGVTWGGGAYGSGVLYKLSRNKTFAVLHSFGYGTDGSAPAGSVLRDDAGNLYGTTYAGGSGLGGIVWKLSKDGGETILHNFAGGSSDGCGSYAGVSRDSRGNLYGVTLYCGAYGYGALYELTAAGSLTLLHSFDRTDGENPVGEVLRTTNGELFGTTFVGGAYGDYGVLWEYLP